MLFPMIPMIPFPCFLLVQEELLPLVPGYLLVRGAAYVGGQDVCR
ncbi:hypothetical protein [Neomoorella mulderi]|nr:hypothetical protein [Moorella mulderi]